MRLTRYSKLWIGLIMLAFCIAIFLQSPYLAVGFVTGHIIGRLIFGGPDYIERRDDVIDYG